MGTTIKVTVDGDMELTVWSTRSPWDKGAVELTVWEADAGVFVTDSEGARALRHSSLGPDLLGKVGTREPPAWIRALPGGSPERLAALDGWRAGQDRVAREALALVVRS